MRCMNDDAELRLVGVLRHTPPGVVVFSYRREGEETALKTKKRAAVIWKEHPAAAEESHSLHPSHGSHNSQFTFHLPA